jgi:hypothetical protein
MKQQQARLSSCLYERVLQSERCCQRLHNFVTAIRDAFRYYLLSICCLPCASSVQLVFSVSTTHNSLFVSIIIYSLLMQSAYVFHTDSDVVF